MRQRAFSSLAIKQIDEDARIIEGIASTPTPDRVGDIVEPKGARFSLPLPLLWQHQRDNPIGHVIGANVTDEGISVRAQLARSDEPGELKQLLDKAWQALKLGLVRGLSIGFKPLERSDIEGTFSTRFISWEWLELSAVTIPANAEATIQAIKAIDDEIRAALGPGDRIDRSRTLPGASGLPVVLLIDTKPRGGSMDLREQITGFENSRAAKAARRVALQETAAKEARSKNDAEREEFDSLGREVETIDLELRDLRALEKEKAASAKPVDGSNGKAAEGSRDPARIIVAESKLDKGIEFARFAMCVAAARGDIGKALNLARLHYPQQKRAIDILAAADGVGMSIEKLYLQEKAAVAAGTSTHATWAGPLVAYNQFAGDFIEYLRPRTILGQFGAGGRPSLRSIPFNVHVRGQTSGGTGYWVGEGKAKPVTKFDFNDTYHGYYKVAAIAVLTEELIRFSDPSAERLVRDALAETLIERIDRDFVDPAKAAVAGISPASITNGVAPIIASGVDADAVRADLQDLWAGAIAANLPLQDAVYITTPSIAQGLMGLRTPLSAREFDGVTLTGGSLDGIPLIVSNYVKPGDFILAFASEIWLSDDGGVTVDASREASVEMDSAPTGDSGTPTGAQLVSMYQTDSVALRAHRFVNWSKRRNSAVAWLDNVGWGGAVAS